MSTESLQPEAQLDERLVAYLDGELDAEGAQLVEDLLSSNAEARRRLQLLDRAWRMLDTLDTDGPGDAFTRSTLEMVALAAEQEVDREAAASPRRRRRRQMAFGGGALAAVAAGFAAVALLIPDPNRNLLDDLPLLENLDEYRQIDNVEFLRLLYSERVVSEEVMEG